VASRVQIPRSPPFLSHFTTLDYTIILYDKASVKSRLQTTSNGGVFMSGNRRRLYVSDSAVEVEFVDDDFAENLNAFLADLKMRDRSKYTIDYYQRELRKFMHTLEDQRLKTNLRAITADLIRSGYVTYVYEEKDVEHATIAATLRALKAFLNWAVGRNIIEDNPMNSVKIGTPKAPTIETFTRDQLRDILSQPDPKLFVGLRDLTIMALMIDTGVRVRELCDIKVDDVRFPDAQILINGKNGEDRLVPMQTQTKRLLNRYIKARGASPVEWLFITNEDRQMNRDSVRRRIAKYGRMANIKNVRCSPHTFRHTFAKMSVQNGADIFTLQRILGHKSMDMVRRYVNMFGGDIKEAHSRFSPFENLRIRL